MPVYLLFVLVVIVTAVVFENGGLVSHSDSLLVLNSFLAILGFSQVVMILAEGLGLSLPWNIAASSILLTQMVQSSNGAALTAPSALLRGPRLLDSAKSIIYGLVVLAAIVALRDRKQ